MSTTRIPSKLAGAATDAHIRDIPFGATGIPLSCTAVLGARARRPRCRCEASPHAASAHVQDGTSAPPARIPGISPMRRCSMASRRGRRRGGRTGPEQSWHWQEQRLPGDSRGAFHDRLHPRRPERRQIRRRQRIWLASGGFRRICEPRAGWAVPRATSPSFTWIPATIPTMRCPPGWTVIASGTSSTAGQQRRRPHPQERAQNRGHGTGDHRHPGRRRRDRLNRCRTHRKDLARSAVRPTRAWCRSALPTRWAVPTSTVALGIDYARDRCDVVSMSRAGCPPPHGRTR